MVGDAFENLFLLAKIALGVFQHQLVFICEELRPKSKPVILRKTIWCRAAHQHFFESEVLSGESEFLQRTGGGFSVVYVEHLEHSISDCFKLRPESYA